MKILTNRITCSVIPAAVALPAVALLVCGCGSEEAGPGDTIRFAMFNIWEMSTEKITDIDANGAGRDEQLKAAAEIIREVRPDVLMLNEIDHDYEALHAGKLISLNAHRFNDAYLNRGEEPLDYPFIYAAPCNTGILAGKDLDHNGEVATEEDRGSREHGGDSYGYGEYPGQYSMAILSRYPLQGDRVRSFQRFLWKDLPDHLIPTEWYTADEIDVLRLSSKSHWDIPVTIGQKSIHMLMSHPTPPIFDGEENRNGRRNYDEIRMWVHYIDNDSVMIDDSGVRGGLADGESFIIAGDLNAAPHGAKLKNGRLAIDQLLKHARISDCRELLISPGALNGREPGPPGFIEGRTAGWGERGLRIDHMLPSIDLKPVRGGVFWPDTLVDAHGSALAKRASDHRMIWLDIELE